MQVIFIKNQFAPRTRESTSIRFGIWQRWGEFHWFHGRAPTPTAGHEWIVRCPALASGRASWCRAAELLLVTFEPAAAAGWGRGSVVQCSYRFCFSFFVSLKRNKAPVFFPHQSHTLSPILTSYKQTPRTSLDRKKKVRDFVKK